MKLKLILFIIFISAFLAATILPFSSEVAFGIALENGMSLVNALFFASSGNILAIILNYFFGYFLYEYSKNRLNSSTIGKKSLAFGHKYGYVLFPFSWLPIVGDPLTIVSGILKLKFLWFILFAGSFRILRYYFISLIF